MRIVLAVVLALELGGCYAAFEPGVDVDASACVELGPEGCLIDHPCWCYVDDVAGVAYCFTCESSCDVESDACGCYGAGPLPPDRCALEDAGV